MSWKHELKVADLDAMMQIEATCRRCGLVRYESRETLEALAQAYLDEVERRLRCRDRACRGAVRIALIHKGRMEGFVGGMA
ncbi:MAG TPA: hypothetical protein VNK48_16560 [Xanthobacteraceae bacterium]|nr:hypothetical protein [Xanthobacteraceae bacterium]